MTNGTLYELTDLRIRIEAALEASEGELVSEIQWALDVWKVDFPAKVQSVVLYLRDILADADKLKAEEDRLKAKRLTLTSRAEWLTNYLQRNLEASGFKIGEKVGGPLGTANLATNPPRVEPVVTLDEADLRNVASFLPQFVRHEEIWSLDKKAVLEAHRRGELPDDIAKRVKISQTVGVRLK